MKYTTDLGNRYRIEKVIEDLFRNFDPFGIFSKFLGSEPVADKGYTPAFATSGPALATAYAPSFGDLDPYQFYRKLVGEIKW